MSRGVLMLAFLLLAACGAAGPGTGSGSGPLPSDVGGLGQDCGQGGHLAEQISTDSRAYSPGATITVTLTATNTSSASCAYPFGCFPAIEVDDATGASVWRSAPSTQPCPVLLRLLMPGESASAQVKVGTSLAPGVYSVTGPEKPARDALGRSYFRVG